MQRLAPWLLTAGLAAVILGCGNDSPTTNLNVGTSGTPNKGSEPTTADQVVSNKGMLFTKGNTMPFSGTLVDSWNS